MQDGLAQYEGKSVFYLVKRREDELRADLAPALRIGDLAAHAEFAKRRHVRRGQGLDRYRRIVARRQPPRTGRSTAAAATARERDQYRPADPCTARPHDVHLLLKRAPQSRTPAASWARSSVEDARAQLSQWPGNMR